MTVKISKPAINLREELASLRNQGGLPKEDKLYLEEVENGDFNNGTVGWSSQFATISASTEQQTVGTHSLKIVCTGNSGGAYFSRKLKAGATYHLKFDVYQVDTGVGSSNRFQIEIGDVLDGSGVIDEAFPATFGQWLSIEHTFVAPESKEYFFFFRETGSVTPTCYLDNVRLQEVGENLVTNGTFDTDSGWTKGTGWTISGGTASKTAGTGDSITSTSLSGTVGKTYTLTFDLTLSAGVINATIGASATPVYNSSGSYTAVLTATTTGSFRFYGSSAFVGSIDNVIVTEGSHPVIQSVPYGYDVKDVYIDGELAREGEAYDYEVKTDGINQWLKPTVEPTATTETVVIGVRK